MGLVKMYRVTGNPKYLEKAKYFCEEAGRLSDGRPASPYSQDHKPIKEQDEAVGHAVRRRDCVAVMKALSLLITSRKDVDLKMFLSVV